MEDNLFVSMIYAHFRGIIEIITIEIIGPVSA